MAESSCCGPRATTENPSCCPSTGQVYEVGTGRPADPKAEVCCGGPPPPPSDPFERPGYSLSPSVRAFKQTGSDFVPLVKTALSLGDHWGTLRVRLGLNREGYRLAPGLYGVGNPDSESPVIVTANYKLTFDAVRKELRDCEVWLLVLDTCGINVWCAAGKKTFSTREIVNRLRVTGLAEKISHRRLILPQLAAAGVSAHEVKRQTGFSVIYGPIRAKDLPRFLQQGNAADEAMRQVSFTLRERMVLIPVELVQFIKKIWWALPVLMLISGLKPGLFSLSQAVERGGLALAAFAAGTLAGAVLAPIFLPWLPGRAFALKGSAAGLGMGFLLLLATRGTGSIPDKICMLVLTIALGSYLAMNFTGSTPFTSPSGVEREMKWAIPLQAVSLAGALAFWIASPFI